MDAHTARRTLLHESTNARKTTVSPVGEKRDRAETAHAVFCIFLTGLTVKCATCVTRDHRIELRLTSAEHISPTAPTRDTADDKAETHQTCHDPAAAFFFSDVERRWQRRPAIATLSGDCKCNAEHHPWHHPGGSPDGTASKAATSAATTAKAAAVSSGAAAAPA